ncbi:drug/metabolite transporter (DMT)-like permease [Streptosporangium lutulentum]|uniref:Drug/metabolite transporter (DMT)-like permease n=1 Tax=Streptosporangium lutulentum TaxID=1461250 RepID=A0ABT9QSY8_9ACTN|nr:drug/metabolite transporter (DMT)-like permease [Streptosporangium lutulentum]
MVLATVCAVVYGTADFFGGLATRRSRVLAVVVLSQTAGLVMVVALLPFLPGTPTIKTLAWGMAAGVSGSVALVLFYRALATGVMSVVAPLTATASAILPVLFGLATGERPEPVALGGVVLALLAVLLVSRGSSPAATAGRSYGSVLTSLAAGAGFGGFFILISQAPEGGGIWPLFGARLASITLIALLALFTGRTLRPGPGACHIIVVAGALDMIANVLFVFAQQRGLLSLVAVLVSLYPASTLLLARYVLGERLNTVQVVGIGFTLAAVALIAAS